MGNTMKKIGKIGGAVLGTASSMIPGVGGTAAKLVSSGLGALRHGRARRGYRNGRPRLMACDWKRPAKRRGGLVGFHEEGWRRQHGFGQPSIARRGRRSGKNKCRKTRRSRRKSTKRSRRR